jgi:metal-responsive CopG/Arc/MetJ family transcriptional regulator
VWAIPGEIAESLAALGLRGSQGLDANEGASRIKALSGSCLSGPKTPTGNAVRGLRFLSEIPQDEPKAVRSGLKSKRSKKNLCQKGAIVPKENITTGIYIDRDLHEIIQNYLSAANCRSRNEFINQAIRFYIAYLQKESDAEFLTPALESVLSGMLGGLENRLARLLFKLAVELSMTMHVLAAQSDVDEDTLRRLRGYCVDEVKRLGGRISFDKAWEHQKE